MRKKRKKRGWPILHEMKTNKMKRVNLKKVVFYLGWGKYLPRKEWSSWSVVGARRCTECSMFSTVRIEIGKTCGAEGIGQITISVSKNIL